MHCFHYFLDLGFNLIVYVYSDKPPPIISNSNFMFNNYSQKSPIILVMIDLYKW